MWFSAAREPFPIGTLVGDENASPSLAVLWFLSAQPSGDRCPRYMADDAQTANGVMLRSLNDCANRHPGRLPTRAVPRRWVGLPG